MKECLCFLFGLIIAIAAYSIALKWLLNNAYFIGSFLVTMHNRHPEIYHSVCEAESAKELENASR